MVSVGQINHIIQGLAALPELYRRESTEEYLSVYLAAFEAQEQAQQELITAILDWSRSSPTHSFVYDLVGGWLGQPRPDGFDNEAYRFILLARARVRKSSNTLNDVLIVADYLARGQPFIVTPVVPRAYVIAFVDLGLTDQEQALYRSLLLDTIGTVDKLELQFAVSGTALYDSLTTVYDSGLYG